jgi:hypothetical protein
VVAEKLRSRCVALYVNTYHVVEIDQSQKWENFTATMGTKLADEDIAAIAEYKVIDWPITSNDTALLNVIYEYDE